ncbi:DUF1841 family protein [Thioflexithrix psekupsensis]|uniref:DUF1841 domain-containing protein n=1 Tax=Thioflexithrix psekupsensis TaxID=1570016 RepID=A0A251X6N2_9GAMM|nr:DUF1841 family protein [Thioflexithrix psekupsensis]OUD12587.1 hypothetical protein TPSD3_16015 [Thioflexithrix psekupsensis]
MFVQNRSESRQFFIAVWQKYQQQQPLEPLEEIIVEVLLQHPEYHHLLTEDNIDRDFLPELGETNPFLHLSLHLALQEQMSTDRPVGIRDLYHQLRFKFQDTHDLEHRILNCLVESLWNAQQKNSAPSDIDYLNCLRQLLRR